MTEPQQGREHSQQVTQALNILEPVIVARLEVIRREVGKKIASDVLKARGASGRAKPPKRAGAEEVIMDSHIFLKFES